MNVIFNKQQHKSIWRAKSLSYVIIFIRTLDLINDYNVWEYNSDSRNLDLVIYNIFRFKSQDIENTQLTKKNNKRRNGTILLHKS